MADTHHNEILGDLLIELSRCLVQYVGEGWPWTASDATEHLSVDEIVIRQKQGVVRLADLLHSRRVAIDFGAYPTEYTDLQYLALDHLLGQLVAGQAALVDLFSQAADNCAGDPEAVAVVKEIHQIERENLDRLRELLASRGGAD